MTRLRTLSIIIVLAGGLAATGCCDQYKKELTGLKHQYNDLQLTKAGLQEDLEACQAKSTDAMTMLASKDTELEAAKAELADLKAQKPGPGTKPEPGWQETATGAKVTLASDILFSPGSAKLSDAGVARIKRIAATIKGKYAGAMVRVYGFTDNDPIKKSAKFWKDNLDLSSNRAMAVVRRLHALGIAAEKLEAIGMGATRYVASNATAAGKAKNRRVEIVVVEQ